MKTSSRLGNATNSRESQSKWRERQGVAKYPRRSLNLSRHFPASLRSFASGCSCYLLLLLLYRSICNMEPATSCSHATSSSDPIVFVDRVPPTLVCPLHMGVLSDPVLCICGHTFCRQCIGNWLKQSSSCPFDSTPLAYLFQFFF